MGFCNVLDKNDLQKSHGEALQKRRKHLVRTKNSSIIARYNWSYSSVG